MPYMVTWSTNDQTVWCSKVSVISTSGVGIKAFDLLQVPDFSFVLGQLKGDRVGI